MASDIVSDDAIRRRAHALWELEGRPEGQAEEHWRRARAEIEEEFRRRSRDAGAERPDVFPLPAGLHRR